MKKHLLFILCMLLLKAATAQVHDTLNYKIFDRFGNVYALADIAHRLPAGNNPQFTTSGSTCQAGFFQLTFEDIGTGRGFDDPSNGLQRRTVVCQAFEDLAQLIVPTNNPVTGQPATVRIRITSSDTGPSGVLANASAYYFEQSAFSTLADGEVWRTINGGVDNFDVNGPLINNYLGKTLSSIPQYFYHGYLNVNFNTPPPGTFYNYSLSNPPQSNEYDFYSIIIHEAIHPLGFASFIGPNGQNLPSIGGVSTFTRYDTHLADASGNRFINDNADCLLQNTTVIPNPSDVTSGCQNVDFAPQQEPVYAPATYITGSSLSHLDDGCSGLHYVMRWSRNPGDIQRKPLHQEANILCALNYTTTSTFGAIPSNPYSYDNTYTPCGHTIAANNDYYFPGTTNPYVMQTGGSDLTISNILSNDVNASAIACAELIDPRGNIAITGMTASSITLHLNFAEQQYYVIAYRAKDNSGNLSNVAYIYVYALPADEVCGNPACNLVPNNSFEDKYICPAAGNNLYSNGWFSIRSGADYYNACSNIGTGFSVPQNNAGYQAARTGNAYAGVAGREKMSIKLCQPLVKNKTYIVQMYASLADGSQGDPDSLGFELTQNWPWYQPLSDIVFTSVTLQAITDTANWTLVQASYTATGGEQYITLGGFSKNSFGGYCYIDDILVSEVLPLIANAGPDIITTGSATIGGSPTAPTGKSPFTYFWLPTTGIVGSNTIANPTVNPAATTTYSVTVTDACGATSTDAMVLYRCGVNAGNDVTICAGSSTQLNATQGATTYKWAPATGLSSTTIYNPTAQPAVTTTYTLTVTDASNCSATDNVVVNITPSYVVNIQPTPGSTTTVCKGDAAPQLMAIPTNNSNTYSYSWSASVPLFGSSTTGQTLTPVNPLTSTTTFTVVVTSGSCSVTASQVVTVNPVPTVTLTASPSYLCLSGNTTSTLTATPISGASYVWSAGTTPGTGNQVTARPATAGTFNYTVTVTNAAGCQEMTSVTLTVVPSPTATITAYPSPLCSGETGTLVATVIPGASYTWSAGITGTGNQVTIHPATSGANIYRVTITSGSCNTVVQQTVTVNASPVVAPSASATFLCPSIPTATLTAGPATANTTYVWSDSRNNIYNGRVITVAPAQTDIYTVTATSQNGCSIVGNILITQNNVCPCTPCNSILPGVLTASPAAQGVYCINSDVHVQGNVTFAAAEFKIGAGATVFVESGATLNILGSHLYSCGDMWKGIVVKDGGKINVNTYTINLLPPLLPRTYYSLIEDADTAIYIQGNGAGSLATLSVNAATFNRNQVGVFILDYANATVTYPLAVQNSVFTCRRIPFTPGAFNWSATPQVSAGNGNAFLNPLAPPYIMANFTPTFLKSPNSTLKPLAGIYFSDAGATLTAGANTTPTYFNIHAGSAGSSFNLFDNLTCGILAVRSNITCVNNVFQNMLTGYPNVFNSIAFPTLRPNGGAGIYGTSQLAVVNNTPATIFYSMRVTGNNGATANNRFYECVRGIYSQNYSENLLTNCDMRSNQHTGLVPPLHPGLYGMDIITDKLVQGNLLNNTLYNLENGINYVGNYPGPVSDILPAGVLNITGNTIQPNAPNTPYMPAQNRYVSNAITVTGLQVGGFPQNKFQVNISSNTAINNVYRGISCQTWRSVPFFVQNNHITLVNDVNFSLPQYGIQYNTISNVAPRASVNNNTITGPAGTNPNTNTMQAVAVSHSTNTDIKCNTVSNTQHGIEFLLSSAAVTFTNNSMQNDVYGYVLNSAVIGTQGDTANPTNNTWLPGGTGGGWNGNQNTGVGNFKTALLNNADANQSVLWVQGGNPSTTNPNGYSTTGPGPQFINRMYTTKPGNKGALRTTQKAPVFGACGGATGGPGGIAGLSLLEQIALDQVSFGIDPQASQFINRHLLYNLLLADSSLADSSAILRQFVPHNRNGCIGLLHSVDAALGLGNYAQAQGLLNSLDLLHPTENAYKTYYTAYLKWKTDTALNPADSAALIALAQGCPFINGAAVYYARSLYNAVYRVTLVFADQCPPYNPNARQNSHTPSPAGRAGVGPAFDVMVYPNPSTGEVFIAPYALTDGNLRIEVRDATGKVVYTDKLQITGGITTFTLNGEVSTGIYFIHITNAANEESVIKKLIIQN